MVDGDIGSLNVAPTLVLMATLVAPLALVVPVTLGAVVSVAAPVVNCQTKLLAKVKPKVSLVAEVTVAVHSVAGGRLMSTGRVSVAVLLAAR